VLNVVNFSDKLDEVLSLFGNDKNK
jgi:hypothetical protein